MRLRRRLSPTAADLPVVTQEIGDTWIYGVASDPIKVARYREVARLRKDWLDQGKFRVGDSTDRALVAPAGALRGTHLGRRYQALEGLSTLHAQRPAGGARLARSSGWRKQAGRRSERISTTALPAFPEPLQSEARDRLHALEPVEPDRAGLAIPSPPGRRSKPLTGSIALDPKTGAIQKLRAKSTGREWASAGPPAGVVQLPDVVQGGLRSLCRRLRRPSKPGGRCWISASPRSRILARRAACGLRRWRIAGPGRSRVAIGFWRNCALTTPRRRNPAGSRGRGRMFLDLLLPDAEPVVTDRFLLL